MASRPKLQRLMATLRELTVQELGEDAHPVDFVVKRVAEGQTVTSLADEVTKAMSEPVSRSWLSWRFNHLTHDAKGRIAAAREHAAHLASRTGNISHKLGSDPFTQESKDMASNIRSLRVAPATE